MVDQGNKKVRKFWPWGVALTALGGASVVLLRGCWHRKMSWPVRVQECSYQVCPGCGIKRLFDERDFRAYGPFSYDLGYLIRWDRERRARQAEEIQPPARQRPAS